jgi:hypothetical protein
MYASTNINTGNVTVKKTLIDYVYHTLIHTVKFVVSICLLAHLPLH